MARKTTQMQAGVIVNPAYVGNTAHGAMTVAAVLARFTSPEEAILYAGSRLTTLDKYAASKKQTPPAPVRPVPTPRVSVRVSPVQISPVQEMPDNKALWAEFVSLGGHNKDGGAMWKAWKAERIASLTPLAPVIVPAQEAKPVRQPSPGQLRARQEFAARRKAEAEARRAPVNTVTTYEPVTAIPPAPPAPSHKPDTSRKAHKVKMPVTAPVPAPVTQVNVPVTRVAPEGNTSKDSMIDWILSQPDPVKVGFAALAARFPTVNNNAKLAVLREVKEAFAS